MMRVVLLLTPEPALRDTLSSRLPATDLVLTEREVTAAERRLHSLHCDLLIVDASPALGPEAATQLRALAPASPVVGLVDVLNPSNEVAWLRAGAQAVWSKPLDPLQVSALLDAPPTHILPAAPPPVIEAAPVHPTPPAPERPVRWEAAMRWLGRAAAYTKTPERFWASLLDAAMEVCGTERVAVLAQHDSGYAIRAVVGLPDELLSQWHLSGDSALAQLAHGGTTVVHRDSAGTAAQRELSVLQAQACAAWLNDGAPAGFLVVAGPSTGGTYRNEELELLGLLARCAGRLAPPTPTAQAMLPATPLPLPAPMPKPAGGLDKIIANLQAALIAVAPDRTVTLVNPSAEAILNRPAIDIVGRSSDQLPKPLADVFDDLLNHPEPRRRQLLNDPSLGGTLGYTASPMNGSGVVLTFTRLAAQENSVEHWADSPFWSFLAERLAQEVKNPLVAINTYAQLLPQKFESAEFRENFSSVVQEEVSRINRVVEYLFDLAEGSRVDLRPIDVSTWLQELVAGLGSELHARAVQLQVSVPPSLSPLQGDAQMLSQALHYLIDNALLATPRGGTITLSAAHGESGHIISLEDGGPGIDPALRDKVFLPFFSTRERGMGLGLTLAWRILREHHGELRLADPANGGRGARFELHFPMRIPSDVQPAHR